MDVDFGNSNLFDFGWGALIEGRDDIAVSLMESFLQLRNADSSWVRELLNGAGDPVSGQAYLDRRIPEIVASMPEEYAYEIQRHLTMWYLYFGFLDRLYELMLDLDLTNSTWTDADYIVYTGTVYRRLAFRRILSISKLPIRWASLTFGSSVVRRISAKRQAANGSANKSHKV